MNEPTSEQETAAPSSTDPPGVDAPASLAARGSVLPRLEGTSVVEHVTVYPRGALVQRRVTLPAALPEGACELVLAGLPLSADASSVRVLARGDRRVHSTRSRVHLPAEAGAATPPPGSHRAERAALLRERRALELRAEAAQTARQHVRDAREFGKEDEERRGLGRHADPLALVLHGEAMATVVDDFAREAEAERATTARALEEIRRKLAALEVLASGRPSLLADPLAPTLELSVELGARDTEPPEQSAPLDLVIEYVVRAARYWPAYTVRFTDRGRRATLSFEPFVVQLSGEDWTDVRLSIATGDLHTDATLPKLPSWRLGRAQSVKSLGYRALPDDSRHLFDDFEAAWQAADVTRNTTRGGPPPPAPARPAAPPPQPHALAPRGMIGGAPAPPGAGSAGGAPPELAFLAAALPLADREEDEGSLPPPPRSAGPMPKLGGIRFGSVSSRASASLDRARVAAPEAAPTSNVEPGPRHPSDEALDFDRLILPSPRSAHRGRLIIEPTSASVGAGDRECRTAPETTIQQLSSPPRTIDPRDAALVFDHVFRGTGTVRVPSSPDPLRVPLGRRAATSTPRLAVVPRETSEVFREADLDNPFDGPLLPGPLDVLQDGSLLAETTLALVDRGGRARVGMGVEDRVKVARNVRVEEKSAGLLGGSRAVDHAITIDVVSALPFATTIEVRDRMPFADEDAGVEVKPGSLQPPPTARETGGGLPGTLATTSESAIVRGGLIWHLPLAASGEAHIQFSYRLTFSSKDEIVGGNRRD
jgi:hypothetical protein